ncbi:hypothetical protein SAMN05216316_1903 [Nitrosovibrio sp. Nv6]|nr:hypothetical protein SAMN05216316_1903 [Nitrosovibrio sp. Nv6]
MNKEYVCQRTERLWEVFKIQEGQVRSLEEGC